VSNGQKINWDREVDVLIFGSGAAGLSAGIFAAKEGLEVLVCEKHEVLGGTTATSGGFVWIPNSDEAKSAGISDSKEEARRYLEFELGEHNRPELTEAFLDNGPLALRELQEGTHVKYNYTSWPDYHAENEGGVVEGRTLEPARFDGRKLGRDFASVRPPIKRLMLLGGMSIDKRKVHDFLRPFQSWSSLWRISKTFTRFFIDRLSYPRGTDVGAGNALICSMYLSFKELNGTLSIKSGLLNLIDFEGKVVGALISKDGRKQYIKANHGVILCTGGFPHNAQMRRELGPNHPHDYSVGWFGNMGDGITAARKIGAAIDGNVRGPGLWQPSSLLRRPDNSTETILYGYLERGRPGLIAVDASGKRFVNESATYHDIVEAMFEHNVALGNRFYFICDSKFIWRYGLGMIRPYSINLKKYEKLDYLVKGASLAELATKLDIDEDQFEQTVHKFNGYAETGEDPDFKRGENPFGRKMLGDPKNLPNPNLGKVESGPYYAIRIYPSTLGTAVGLSVNEKSQVTDSEGRAIPGLYASGQDMTSVMRGYYPSGGVNIGGAITFSYIAIQSVLAK